MSNDTTIAVRGNAGTVPSLYGNGDGDQWTFFRLASTRSYRTPDGQWREDPPLWFTVRVYGALAARVSQLVRRGTPLLVRGRLSEDSWTDQGGQPRSSTCIRADAVGIDVMGRGNVLYTPPVREGQGAPGAEAPKDFGALGISGAERVLDGEAAFVRAGAYLQEERAEDWNGPDADDGALPITGSATDASGLLGSDHDDAIDAELVGSPA